MARLKAPPRRLQSPPPRVGHASRQEAERARDAMRTAQADTNLRRLYATKRWRDPETGMRARILARDGWACRICATMLTGQHPEPSSPVVDHITPHKGNLALFWDEANLQALCKRCHDTTKQAEDRAAAARW
ncbi:HNH endonuclease [Rhodobacterales bacterium HKCCE3408]|nr:HNH endonuclease [Rhodobacterales bacterium HKCCE3408]